MYFLCVLLNDTEWPIQCERTCQTVGDRDRSIIGIGVGWLVFLKKLVLVSVCYSNAKIDIRIGIFLFKDFGPDRVMNLEATHRITAISSFLLQVTKVLVKMHQFTR